MVTSLIRPSYHQNFATRGLSKRPNLWRGLVGAWKPSLGVTGITTLRDVSGFGNHGTMNGSMTIDDWVLSGNPKIPGYALDYEGTDDYILANAPAVVPPFSMAAWVYIHDLATSDFMMATLADSSVGNQQYRLSWANDPGDEFRADVFSDTFVNAGNPATFDATDGLGAITVNTWYFVVGVWAATNDRRIYVNGRVGTPNATEDNNPTGIDVFGIGATVDNTQVGFANGLIDTTCRWNRIISQSEALDMYNFPNAMFQFRDRVIAKAPAVVTVPDDTLAATMQMANSGGMIGAVNV